MKIIEYNVSGTNKSTIRTEVLFAIASAKSQGADLLSLKIITDNGTVSKTRILTLERELRQAKKNGQIQLFVLATALDVDTTETEYLKNKFPSLFSMPANEGSFIVKT